MMTWVDGMNPDKCKNNKEVRQNKERESEEINRHNNRSLSNKEQRRYDIYEGVELSITSLNCVTSSIPPDNEVYVETWSVIWDYS